MLLNNNFILTCCLTLIYSSSTIASGVTSYVNANTLNVRYQPNTTSPKAGALTLGQAVTSLTPLNRDWVKIKQPTTELTGWVASRYLSSNPLTNHQRSVAQRALVKAIIKQSDDFDIYENQLMKATLQLIEARRCNYSTIQEMQGWWRTLHPQYGLLYFIYCGKNKKRQPIYLNPINGKLISFQP